MRTAPGTRQVPSWIAERVSGVDRAAHFRRGDQLGPCEGGRGRGKSGKEGGQEVQIPVTTSARHRVSRTAQGRPSAMSQ